MNFVKRFVSSDLRITKIRENLWKIKAAIPEFVPVIYDDLCIEGYRNGYIVETPLNKFDVTKSGKWYCQLIKVTREKRC